MSTATVHPAREYVSQLPLVWRGFRHDLRMAFEQASDVWPFTWKVKLLREVERAFGNGYEQGRITERLAVEREVQR